MYNHFIETVLKTNKYLKNYIDNHLSQQDIEYNGTIGYGGDKSLNFDIKAEKRFIYELMPFGDIYSEESGLTISEDPNKIKGARIVIDPLDGSDNFLSGLKYYGTSVALQIDGETKAAIVYNLVDGTYIIKDEKGVVNTNRSISAISKMAVFERSYKYPKICEKLYEKGIKHRAPGAVALSLANAQNYSFVLFGGKLRSFDLEAALFINSNLNIYKNEEFLLLAKNIEIFNEIKEIIKEE